MKHKLCLFNNRDINACSIDLLLACFCSKWSSTKWHKCILLTCFWHVSVQNHHQRNASMGSMDFVAENGTIKIIVPIYFWWAWTFHAFEESHLHEGFHILRFFLWSYLYYGLSHVVGTRFNFRFRRPDVLPKELRDK